jgi:two-component system response regulator YcbB
MDRFYLVDDDTSITAILRMIIMQRGLGEVAGTNQDPQEALEDIEFEKPDIIIVDMLMPEMDGVTFVRRARRILPEAGFIMLSQVSSKDMIAQAYEAGCDFFIQKPINSVEVENVVRSVSEKRRLRETVGKVRSLFADPGAVPAAGSPAAASPAPAASPAGGASAVDAEEVRQTLEGILEELGIVGDKGCPDIISVVTYAVAHPGELDQTTVKNLCGHFTDNPKTMEQRIRRAAQGGLTNLAHLGLEDYGNPAFEEYASTLYQFEQVRREMDFVRGKTTRHGVVKLKKFIAGLAGKCKNY